jgi:DNA-binding CsgD family transcriptional regulator
VCFTHAQAGEAKLAIRAGSAAVEGGRRLSPGIFVALPHVNLGAALLEAGEYERALAQLAEGEARGAAEHYVGRCWWELWTARAHLGLGDRAQARQWLGRAGATADDMGLIGRRGAVLALEAELAGAAPMAFEAAELLDEGGRASDAARARMAAGRMVGDIQALQRARAVFVECGAPRLADRAASELRRLGVRVARSGARAGRLSAREHEIAELVGSGQTNRQIAGELHLSESTVENHLSRVYRKLGISSRAALAALISSGNLGDDQAARTHQAG